MGIEKIISVNFTDKKRIHLPKVPLNRPGIQRLENRIPPLPYFDFLIKQKSLEGIIQILNRAHARPENDQRYSYFSGLSKSQWCDVLEREVRKAKPFSDN